MLRERKTRRNPGDPRRVALLAFPEAQILDVIGPLEVFSSATRLLAAIQPSGSRLQLELLASCGEGPVRMSIGVPLFAQGLPPRSARHPTR